MNEIDALPRLGQGFYWQELIVGQKFRTFRRTVTEADLVGFIGATGMLEAIFIDTEFAGQPVSDGSARPGYCFMRSYKQTCPSQFQGVRPKGV